MVKDAIETKFRIVAKNMIFGTYEEAEVKEKFVIQEKYWWLADLEGNWGWEWKRFKYKNLIQEHYNSEEEALAALTKALEIIDLLSKEPRIIKEIII